MLEAVLVLAAAVADAFGPRWALLTEIALLRHQARRPSTLGCQAARGAIRPNRPGRTRRCHPDVEERPAHRPTRDPSSLAPRRLQGSLALAESNAPRTAPRHGDGRADPVDGLGEQTLGRREDPRRTAQARRQRDARRHKDGRHLETLVVSPFDVDTSPEEAKHITEAILGTFSTPGLDVAIKKQNTERWLRAHLEERSRAFDAQRDLVERLLHQGNAE